MERDERDEGDARDARELRWVLPATILGSSLSFVDASVVNVALPAMQRSLDASLGTMQWVVNGYMLTLASLILIGGSAGDRFGRRTIFSLGLIGFAIASLACALAPSAPWLIAARLAQGVAAALVTPASLAIISAAYEGVARGRAIGTWAAAGALTTSLGPMFGGWLVDTISWRAIFLINLPLAAIALLLAAKLSPDRDPGITSNKPLDRSGALLAILALGSLSYGLIELGEGAEARGTAAVLVAAPATWLLVRREQRASEPMLPPSMFRNRTFSGANALTVLLYAALGGALFLLPFMLIRVHDYSATAAGAAFLPFSVIMGLGARWAGGFVERFGAKPPLIVGPAITAAGFALLSLTGEESSYWIGFLPGLVIVGIGMTIAVPTLTTTVFDSAPDERSGTASGINNAAARAGSLVAVAALGLAFGGVNSAQIGRASLSEAYQIVMSIAAGVAAASALVAALTIRSRVSVNAGEVLEARHRHRKGAEPH